MKYGFVVAAAVPYVKVADCFYNIDRMKAMILDAEARGVEILSFPELSITGYTLRRPFPTAFPLDKAKEALCQLVKETADTNILVIVGHLYAWKQKLFNAAIVFQKDASRRDPQDIPTQLPREEKRWFLLLEISSTRDHPNRQ